MNIRRMTDRSSCTDLSQLKKYLLSRTFFISRDELLGGGSILIGEYTRIFKVSEPETSGLDLRRPEVVDLNIFICSGFLTVIFSW